MRSSSEGFVGIFELGTAAECGGTVGEWTTTGREVVIGGGGATETIGFGASQVPAGTRAAAAALPMSVARTVGPDGKGAAEVATEGRGAEGTAGLGGMGATALRMAVMSTLPTGT